LQLLLVFEMHFGLILEPARPPIVSGLTGPAAGLAGFIAGLCPRDSGNSCIFTSFVIGSWVFNLKQILS